MVCCDCSWMFSDWQAMLRPERLLMLPMWGQRSDCRKKMPLAASWAPCPQHSPIDEASRRTGGVDNLGGYALGRTYCLAGTYCAPFLRNLSPRVAPLFALLHHPLLCAVHLRLSTYCSRKLMSLLLLLLLALLSNTAAVCVSFCLGADLSDHLLVRRGISTPRRI